MSARFSCTTGSERESATRLADGPSGLGDGVDLQPQLQPQERAAVPQRAFIPVFVFPSWLALTSKVIVPTTLGMDATRRILTGGGSLGGLWSDGTLPWALLHAAVVLLLGWTVYQAAIRRGLREGRLGA